MKMIWWGLNIKENSHVLVNQFHENFRFKTLGCRKIKSVFRDVKWCFNSSWGLKGLKARRSLCVKVRLYRRSHKQIWQKVLLTTRHRASFSNFQYMGNIINMWWLGHKYRVYSSSVSVALSAVYIHAPTKLNFWIHKMSRLPGKHEILNQCWVNVGVYIPSNCKRKSALV